ncbi:MAG: alpha-galactosidase [Kiritimatiellales bacterium]
MHNIVIIGAGSLEFSSRLTADILSYENTRDVHFSLVDIDEKRLAYAGRIIERIFRDGDYSKASYSLHADRRNALQNADAVIISILVGGYEAIVTEIDIPMAYGVDQCIGDTLTPGGIMRCLRTLPALVAIGRDIMEICPNAEVLNYTNPMSMLTWGMFKAVPGIRMVGLCHSVQHTLKKWADRLKIPVQDIRFDCAGLNHQAWYTTLEADGKDLLPRIRELCVRQDIWNSDTVRMEYLKHFGFPVTESSGHCSEYSPWFRKRPELVERYCDTRENIWNGSHAFIKELYSRPDWEAKMEKLANRETPFSLERSAEYGSRIISALAGGEEVVIYGNVMNESLVDNLPQAACVEVACAVDRNGIHPRHYGSLPLHLAAINRTQISVQELAVNAALNADPEQVFQAMCMDPLTGAVLSLDEIRNMTRELMQAHAEWIPQFAGRLPKEKAELRFKASTEIPAK